MTTKLNNKPQIVKRDGRNGYQLRRLSFSIHTHTHIYIYIYVIDLLLMGGSLFESASMHLAKLRKEGFPRPEFA